MADCKVCGKSIGFMSTSFWGNESLADGGKICGECITRIKSINGAMAANIGRYTAAHVITTLNNSVPNRGPVFQQLQNLGVDTGDNLARAEMELLPNYINDGEQITGFLRGYSNYTQAIMVATDKRAFILDKRNLTEEIVLKNLNYDKITNIDYGVRMDQRAYLKVFTDGEDVSIGDLDVAEGKRFADILREQMAKAKQITVNVTQATAGTDVASQLEKFAGLFQQGLLTKEEFDAQKKKLLGL